MQSRFRALIEHDLFGNPLHTLRRRGRSGPDHAAGRWCDVFLCSDRPGSAGVDSPDRRPGGGPGCAPEYAGRVRLLRAVAIVVALLLRGVGGAGKQRALAAGAMRRPTILLRGARAVAAIRARLSRILPAAL